MVGDLLYFIHPEVKRECIGLIKKNWKKVESKYAIEAFRFLERNINL